jgi:hypothetical protein
MMYTYVHDNVVNKYNRVSKSRTIHLTCPTVHTLIGSCEINHRNTTQSISKCFTLTSSTVSLHSFFSFERGTLLFLHFCASNASWRQNGETQFVLNSVRRPNA